jgi:hypothetical protein
MNKLAGVKPQVGMSYILSRSHQACCRCLIATWCLLQIGTNKVQIDSVLMPDSLHPNAKGMDVFLDCLDLHLKPYLPIKSLRRIS